MGNKFIQTSNSLFDPHTIPITASSLRAHLETSLGIFSSKSPRPVMQYLKTLYLPALALLAITACALPLEPSEGKLHDSSSYHAGTDFLEPIVISVPDRNATAVPAATEQSAGRNRGGPREANNWCWRHVCIVKSRDRMQGRADLTGWPFPHGRAHLPITDASED